MTHRKPIIKLLLSLAILMGLLACGPQKDDASATSRSLINQVPLNEKLFYGMPGNPILLTAVRLGDLMEQAGIMRILNGYALRDYLINETGASEGRDFVLSILSDPEKWGIDTKQPLIFALEATPEANGVSDATLTLSVLIDEYSEASIIFDALVKKAGDAIEVTMDGKTKLLVAGDNVAAAILTEDRLIVKTSFALKANEQAAQIISGYKLGGADTLRGVMGKKIDLEELKAMAVATSTLLTSKKHKAFISKVQKDGSQFIAFSDQSELNASPLQSLEGLGIQGLESLAEYFKYYSYATVAFANGKVEAAGTTHFSPETFSKIDLLSDDKNMDAILMPTDDSVFFGVTSLQIEKLKDLLAISLDIAQKNAPDLPYAMDTPVPLVGFTPNEIMDSFDGTFALSIDDAYQNIATGMPSVKGYLSAGLANNSFPKKMYQMYGAFAEPMLAQYGAKIEVSENRLALIMSDGAALGWDQLKEARAQVTSTTASENLVNDPFVFKLDIGESVKRLYPIANQSGDPDAVKVLNYLSKLDSLVTRYSSDHKTTMSSKLSLKTNASVEDQNILQFLSTELESIANPVLKNKANQEKNAAQLAQYKANPEQSKADYTGTWYVQYKNADGEGHYLETRNPDGTYTSKSIIKEFGEISEYEESGTWKYLGLCYIYSPDEEEAWSYATGILEQSKDNIASYYSYDDGGITTYLKEVRVDASFKLPTLK